MTEIDDRPGGQRGTRSIRMTQIPFLSLEHVTSIRPTWQLRHSEVLSCTRLTRIMATTLLLHACIDRSMPKVLSAGMFSSFCPQLPHSLTSFISFDVGWVMYNWQVGGLWPFSSLFFFVCHQHTVDFYFNKQELGDWLMSFVHWHLQQSLPSEGLHTKFSLSDHIFGLMPNKLRN